MSFLGGRFYTGSSLFFPNHADRELYVETSILSHDSLLILLGPTLVVDYLLELKASNAVLHLL